MEWKIAVRITNMIHFSFVLYQLSYLTHVIGASSWFVRTFAPSPWMERDGFEPSMKQAPSCNILPSTPRTWRIVHNCRVYRSATSPYSIFITEIRMSCVGGNRTPISSLPSKKRIIAVRVTWSMTTTHNVLSVELPRKIAETGFEPVTSGAWTRQATTAPLRHNATSPLGCFVSSAMSFLAFLT